jgi:hypothetical protein
VPTAEFKGNILQMLDGKDYFVSAAQFLMALVIILSFPLFHFACRNSVELVFFNKLQKILAAKYNSTKPNNNTLEENLKELKQSNPTTSMDDDTATEIKLEEESEYYKNNVSSMDAFIDEEDSYNTSSMDDINDNNFNDNNNNSNNNPPSIDAINLEDSLVDESVSKPATLAYRSVFWSIDYLRLAIETLLICGSAFIVGMLFPNVTIIFALSGATTGTLIYFIFPSLMLLLHSIRTKKSIWKVIIPLLYLIAATLLGILCLGVTITDTVVTIINKIRDGWAEPPLVCI